MFRGDAHPGKLTEAGLDYIIGDIRRLMRS